MHVPLKFRHADTITIWVTVQFVVPETKHRHFYARVSDRECDVNGDVCVQENKRLRIHICRRKLKLN